MTLHDMYVRMYVCVYVCMYVCMYVRTWYARLYVCMFARISTYVCSMMLQFTRIKNF